MGMFSKVMNPFSSVSDKVSDKLSVMPERDKRALQALLLFFVAMLFYGVFVVHKHANKAEASAMTTQQQLFWMRGQASNITTQNTADRPALESMVRETATSQNIVVNAVASGSSVQFSASHKNASILGSFLSRLEQEGVKFQRLDISQKQDLALTAEATVSY